MMKFISLALASAASASIVSRQCQQPDVVQNFDLTDYLGTWYEAVRDQGTWYERGICVTAQYSALEDGTVRVQNDIWQEDKQKWQAVTISAEVADPSKDEGYLLVGGSDYKVISTDYTGYTLIYCCQELGKFASSEQVWILVRDPTTDLSEDQKNEILSALDTQLPEYDIFTNGQITE